MRSTVVLVLAAAGFGWFLLQTHTRAAAVAGREEAALAALRTLSSRRADGPLRPDGYLVERSLADEPPALWVARPTEPGRSGVRWFATADGRTFYEVDTVLHAFPGDTPDLTPLRAWLALPEGRRDPRDRPFGWRRVE